MTKRRRLLLNLLALAVFGAAALGFTWPYWVPPMENLLAQEKVRHALSQATEIRVIEHSNSYDQPPYAPPNGDYQEKVYRQVTLSPEQRTALLRALPLSVNLMDYVATGKACLFISHHRVEARQPDGTTFTLELCFHCGQFQYPGHAGSLDMPPGWIKRLDAFFTTLSMTPHGPWPQT